MPRPTRRKASGGLFFKGTKAKSAGRPPSNSPQLPDGKWFSVASSGIFGYRLVCKKA